MGLSFLNKKSWHTASFQNIEKVWIAEQKKKDEDRKQHERAKKLKEEVQGEELKKLQVQAGLLPASALDRQDWIYDAAPKLQAKTKDEQLQSKPFETLGSSVGNQGQQQNQTQQVVQESYGNSNNEAFTRLHEDPLFLIKQEELKRREEIVKNPLRMKQIYDEIDEKSKKKKKHKKEKKEKKSKKKHKKHKEKKHRSASSSESERPKKHKHRSRSDSNDSENSSRSHSRKRKHEKNRKKKSSHKHRHDSSDSSKSRSNSRDRQKKKSEKTNTMFTDYLKRRLGPNVQIDTSNGGFQPDFNINRRKKQERKEAQQKRELDEEERRRMLDEMKQNANELQEYKKELIKKEIYGDDTKEKTKEGEHFLNKMRKDVYGKEDKVTDLGDRVARNMHYYSKRDDGSNSYRR